MNFESLAFWHWWVLAVVLVVLEILAPGVFFLWLGVAAGITGLVLLAVPDTTWQVQVLTFAVLSVASIAGWRYYQKGHPAPTDQPALNRRGEQYVGRTLTLEEPIVNGRGKIRVDDTTWRVEGDDLPAGTRIKVVAVDGVVLKVEKG
jgi:hypothetical protein